MFIRVVLPLPFSPAGRGSPRFTSRSIPSLATTLPKRLVILELDRADLFQPQPPFRPRAPRPKRSLLSLATPCGKGPGAVAGRNPGPARLGRPALLPGLIFCLLLGDAVDDVAELRCGQAALLAQVGFGEELALTDAHTSPSGFWAGWPYRGRRTRAGRPPDRPPPFPAPPQCRGRQWRCSARSA